MTLENFCYADIVLQGLSDKGVSLEGLNPKDVSCDELRKRVDGRFKPGSLEHFKLYQLVGIREWKYFLSQHYKKDVGYFRAEESWYNGSGKFREFTQKYRERFGLPSMMVA